MKEMWPIGLFVVVISLLVIGIVHRVRVHARCTNNGGHWERVNCHLVEDQNCMTMDYGQGMAITTCSPSTSEVCDNVCRCARPEATAQ